MKTLSRFVLSTVFAAAVLGLFSGNFVQAVEYVAIDLTPAGCVGSNAHGVSGTQQAGSIRYDGLNHAVIWNGTASGYIELTPDGFRNTIAYATNGTQQVGSGFVGMLANEHAFLWNGSSTDYVDLTPSASMGMAHAYGIGGLQQVGDVINHAYLWSGTPESAVDLHPGSDYAQSIAYGTDGSRQVGEAYPSSTWQACAFLWSNTGASGVNLHPDTFINSTARAVCGTQQVGYGNINNNYTTHALLWSGTAASAIDLNPWANANSAAYGTNGSQQVGKVDNHASLWNGSASSYVDLTQFLPSEFSGSGSLSCATGIDTHGNIVGYAMDATTYEYHAILWTPVSVPEPSAFVLLGIGALGLIVCRLRWKAG